MKKITLVGFVLAAICLSRLNLWVLIRWGPIMLDGGGRFMLLIARPGLPNFAANKRDAGTPEENKAVLAGLLAFIGTYSVSEGVLILHVEAGTFPNWNGTDQKRYLTLSNDQMLWTNRTPAIGAEVVEVV